MIPSHRDWHIAAVSGPSQCHRAPTGTWSVVCCPRESSNPVSAPFCAARDGFKHRGSSSHKDRAYPKVSPVLPISSAMSTPVLPPSVQVAIPKGFQHLPLLSCHGWPGGGVHAPSRWVCRGRQDRAFLRCLPLPWQSHPYLEHPALLLQGELCKTREQGPPFCPSLVGHSQSVHVIKLVENTASPRIKSRDGWPFSILGFSLYLPLLGLTCSNPVSSPIPAKLSPSSFPVQGDQLTPVQQT